MSEQRKLNPFLGCGFAFGVLIYSWTRVFALNFYRNLIAFAIILEVKINMWYLDFYSSYKTQNSQKITSTLIQKIYRTRKKHFHIFDIIKKIMTIDRVPVPLSPFLQFILKRKEKRKFFTKRKLLNLNFCQGNKRKSFLLRDSVFNGVFFQ